MNKVPCALALVLCALIFSSNTLVAGTDPARVGAEAAEAEAEAVKVYLDPPYVNASEAGEDVNVSILIENANHLYEFSVCLKWDPAVLELVNVTEGPFLGPTEEIVKIAGTINNTAGEMFPPYAIARTIPRTWKSGDGALANLTYRAKEKGIFNVYITEVYLGDDSDWFSLPFPAHVVNVFMVRLRPYELLPGVRLGIEAFNDVEVNSNLTWGIASSDRHRVLDGAFNLRAKEIRFSIISKPYESYFSAYSPLGGEKEVNVTGGSCSVAIPGRLLSASSGGWRVLLNGSSTPYTTRVWFFLTYEYVEGGEEDGAEPVILQNITMTTLSFNFTLGNYEVRIVGEAVGAGSYTLPFLAAVVAVVALAAVAILWKKGLLRRAARPPSAAATSPPAGRRRRREKPPPSTS